MMTRKIPFIMEHSNLHECDQSWGPPTWYDRYWAFSLEYTRKKAIITLTRLLQARSFVFEHKNHVGVQALNKIYWILENNIYRIGILKLHLFLRLFICLVSWWFNCMLEFFLSHHGTLLFIVWQELRILI